MDDPTVDIATQLLPGMELILKWIDVLEDHEVTDPEAVQAMSELRQVVEKDLLWFDMNVNPDPTIRSNDTLWSYTSSLAQIGHALDRQKAEHPEFLHGPAARIAMAGVYIRENLLPVFKRVASAGPDRPIH